MDENEGTLTIAEARASDSGRYTCEVASDGGNDRHSANLDVIELPYAPTLVSAERVPSAHKSVNVSWTPGNHFAFLAIFTLSFNSCLPQVRSGLFGHLLRILGILSYKFDNQQHCTVLQYLA